MPPAVPPRRRYCTPRKTTAEWQSTRWFVDSFQIPFGKDCGCSEQHDRHVDDRVKDIPPDQGAGHLLIVGDCTDHVERSEVWQDVIQESRERLDGGVF